IEIYGRHFINSETEEPFYIKGIAYQPGGSSAFDGKHDPLSDIETCARDIAVFQELGVNTVRVYSVNPDLNHDECMSLLAAAGIYLILDVNSPVYGQHINREQPWETYTTAYLEHIFRVVDQFSTYTNTLAYIAGNEVISDNKKETSPYAHQTMKAVIKDLKDYIAENVDRKIPVGYSNADVFELREELFEYLTCGEEDEIADFFGINSYQWCGKTTYKDSGLDKLKASYADTKVPVFYSEFGCNEVQPRTFGEIPDLFTTMADVFSGGIAYEYSMEANNYGIVKLDESTCTAKLLPDFMTLGSLFLNTVPKVPAKLPAPEKPNKCPALYKHLEMADSGPDIAADLIDNGVEVKRGRFV
ncbi:glycoside hydrolase family 72 protein, partial [Tortispora caseinolytica NRRL Y-17796]